MNNNEDVFDGYGIRVDIKGNFSRIREALTRIGIADSKNKRLIQSCHIFHKRGQYAIMHFLEMFKFDGKTANITDEDIARRNKIVLLLEQWGLLKIVDEMDEDDPVAPHDSFVILSKNAVSEQNWQLVRKYTIGKVE